MRKAMLLMSVIAILANPLVVMADEVTVKETKTESTTANPVVEVVLLPVRLVTGVIAAPIGAVGGLITGFAKGFAWPSRAERTETTQKTVSSDS